MTKDIKFEAPTVHKAVKLLEFICEANRPVGVVDIINNVDISKNMCFRILKTLHDCDWLTKDAHSPKYQLSLKPFYYVSKTVDNVDINLVASKPLEDLSEKLGELVSLKVLDNDQTLLIKIFQPTKGIIRLAIQPGLRCELHAGAPEQVILANNDDIFAKLAKKGFKNSLDGTIINTKELKKELIKIKKQGYALDNEAFFKGLICTAAPIFNREGKVIASVCVSVLTMFYSLEQLENEITLDIIKTANEISKNLGFDINNKGDYNE